MSLCLLMKRSVLDFHHWRWDPSTLSVSSSIASCSPLLQRTHGTKLASATGRARTKEILDSGKKRKKLRQWDYWQWRSHIELGMSICPPLVQKNFNNNFLFICFLQKKTWKYTKGWFGKLRNRFERVIE
jgi:hypothetical protein